MRLGPGVRVGTYEIIGVLGAGGMGEVYRARDTKLKRDVAIKALPEEFSRDPGPHRSIPARSRGAGVAQSHQHREHLRTRGVAAAPDS